MHRITPPNSNNNRNSNNNSGNYSNSKIAVQTQSQHIQEEDSDSSGIVFVQPPVDEVDIDDEEDVDNNHHEYKYNHHEREPLALQTSTYSSSMSIQPNSTVVSKLQAVVASKYGPNTNDKEKIQNLMDSTTTRISADEDDDDEFDASSDYKSENNNNVKKKKPGSSMRSSGSKSWSLANKVSTTNTTANNNNNNDNTASFSRNGSHSRSRSRSHHAILNVLHGMTQHAAHHPWTYIVGTMVVSLGLFLLGSTLTNVNYPDANWKTMATTAINRDHSFLLSLAPKHSQARELYEWIQHDSGFHPTTTSTRTLSLLLHANGANVVTLDAVHRVFQVIETVQATPGYESLCSVSLDDDAVTHIDPVSGKRTCYVSSVTRFWNQTSTLFKQQVASDQDVAMALSQSHYPDDQTPVDIDSIVGRAVFGLDKILTSAQSLLVEFQLPASENDKTTTLDFERRAQDRIHAVRTAWANNNNDNPYRLEYYSQRSYADEYQRDIDRDTSRVLPFVFLVMTLVTMLVFTKTKDALHSRALLGFGAVASVLLALLAGYGLLLLCNVPVSLFTQILPIVILGMGLNQTFVFMGEYARTDTTRSVQERIYDTMEVVGISLCMTTLTTALFFAVVASTSRIPMVTHVCLYAMVTVLLVFCHHVTFFMAVLVLDEQRIQDNRRDCLVCFAVGKRTQRVLFDSQFICEFANDSPDIDYMLKPPCQVRIMSWYADPWLLQPRVKMTLLLAFLALYGVLIYSSTLQTQEFHLADTVPRDSHVTAYWKEFQAYTNRGSGLTTYAYFRHVNQSDPAIQDQMFQYVDDLVPTAGTSNPPRFFWLNDYRLFQSRNEVLLYNKTFAEQLDEFLSPNYVYRDLYQKDIVRDSDGNIAASRVLLYMDQVNIESVQDQLDAWHDQNHVTRSEPINRYAKNFFTFDTVYLLWQFYAVTISEVTRNILAGVVTVTVMTLVFLPHWTAAVFVFPVVLITYIDFWGALYVAGVHVNVVSHVAMVLSMGWIVDSCMPVLLAYYESNPHYCTRDGKVKDMLVRRGSSLLVSTMVSILGVLVVLVITTSDVYRTILVSFLSVIAIAAGHGLIVLPVVLSLVGPTQYEPQQVHLQSSSSAFAPASSLVAQAFTASVTTSAQQKWAEEVASLRQMNRTRPPV